MGNIVGHILVPLSVTLGIIIVGAIIGEVLNVPNATAILFATVGGFHFLSRFFG